MSIFCKPCSVFLCMCKPVFTAFEQKKFTNAELFQLVRLSIKNGLNVSNLLIRQND